MFRGIAWLCSALAFASAFVSLQARAQLETVANGADAALTYGTVVATAESGSAIWYNPACLVAIEDGTFDLSGSVYSMRLSRNDELLTTASGERAHSDQFGFRVVPRALSFAVELREGVVFASGVLHSLIDDTSLAAELDTDEGNIWAASHRSEGSTLHLPFALALTLRDDLAIGFTVDAAYANSFRVDVVAGEASGDTGVPYSSADDTEWYAFGPQARFGIRWEPKPGYRVGAMIGSPTLGVYRGLDRLKSHAGPGNGREVTVGRTGVTKQRGANIDQLEPGRMRLGLARMLTRGWVALDGDLRFPMKSEVRFNTGWGSTLRLGGLIQIKDRMRVGGALFTMVERDTQLQGFGAETINYYGANVGIDVANQSIPGVRRTRLALALAVNYAYGTGTRTGLRVGQDPTARAPELRDYGIRVHDVSFNLALRASR